MLEDNSIGYLMIGFRNKMYVQQDRCSLCCTLVTIPTTGPLINILNEYGKELNNRRHPLHKTVFTKGTNIKPLVYIRELWKTENLPKPRPFDKGTSGIF